MRRAALVLLAILGAGPAAADAGDKLAKFTAGKEAGAPLACILPDFSARPQVIDGQAIVYFRGRTTYVGRFEGAGCPQLRESRTFVTSSLAGRLCRHDQVRVVEQGGAGGSGFGFCTFAGFTPYTRAR